MTNERRQIALSLKSFWFQSRSSVHEKKARIKMEEILPLLSVVSHRHGV